MAEISLDKALIDPRLFGAALGDVSSWATWLVVLKAGFGMALSDSELTAFATVAGNRAPPPQRVRELWAIVGRRGGKSRIAAAIGVYLAVFLKHVLAPGEQGMVLILAATQTQARVVFGYALAFLQTSPVLRQEITEVTRDEIRLNNGIVIAIHSNSFRTVRGRTLVGCIFDEVALWQHELSANPDIETYSAVLPSLLTTRGMLIGISSPYRRIGLLYSKHRDHYGINSPDVLVVQGSTIQFNQTLSETDIAPQRAADPTAATSEWDGLFRDDIASFLDDAVIDAAIEHGRPLELPPLVGTYYQAFVDAAGGGVSVGADSYSIAIAHKQGPPHCQQFVIDVVRGTTGAFDPIEVTKVYAALCRGYRIGTVVGDYYAAEWVASAWKHLGINYARSVLPKSQLYIEALPLFARGMVRLPDNPRLIRELRLLERHTHRGGKDSIDHPRGGHDDHANCVCGVLRNISNYLGYNQNYEQWVGNTDWLSMRNYFYVASGGQTRLW
jgi:hypothetical protein